MVLHGLFVNGSSLAHGKHRPGAYQQYEEEIQHRGGGGMMIGDLIIAAFIGIAVGVLLGVPCRVAYCHAPLEEIDKERENDDKI